MKEHKNGCKYFETSDNQDCECGYYLETIYPTLKTKPMNSLNRDKKKICEAVYGNKKCQKVAIMSVISNGELFNLCLDCAKNARLQIKLNK